MTKEEIQALIDAKIAGQGTMVDVGGALPTILKEIVDMASAGANVQSDWAQDDDAEVDFIKNKPNLDFVPVTKLTLEEMQVPAGNYYSEITLQQSGEILNSPAIAINERPIGLRQVLTYTLIEGLIEICNDVGEGVDTFYAFYGNLVPAEGDSIDGATGYAVLRANDFKEYVIYLDF